MLTRRVSCDRYALYTKIYATLLHVSIIYSNICSVALFLSYSSYDSYNLLMWLSTLRLIVEYNLHSSLCNKWHDIIYCTNFSYSYSYGNGFQMILNISIGIFLLKRCYFSITFGLFTINSISIKMMTHQLCWNDNILHQHAFHLQTPNYYSYN